VQENAALLASAGLLVEPFGPGTVKIDGVPPMLAEAPPGEVLLRVADDCRAGGGASRGRAIEEAIARSVCRAAGVRDAPAGTAEVRRLMEVLMACELPYACPQGRPTMIHFSYGELDRKFGRNR
jgi:DNA mismatch repair protein MutL